MMKTGSYFAILFMSLACVILTVALVVMGHNNQKLQLKLQAQQQVLSQGVLGPQAQQISGALLQTLAEAAADNLEIRQMMEKHGYRIPEAKASASKEDNKKAVKTADKGKQAGKAKSAEVNQ